MRPRRSSLSTPSLDACPLRTSLFCPWPPLFFQSLTTLKSSKPFVLITMRNAGGCTYSPSPRNAMRRVCDHKCGGAAFVSLREERAEVPLRVEQGDGILQGQVLEARVDFFAFDKVYVERLRNGDPATEHHFFVYFEKLLHIKLRARTISPDKVEDLKQDTFIRVITAVRKGSVRQPERFGAFVNSICNNVLLEHYRTLGKNQQMDETHEEIPDKVLDLEGMMVSKQCTEQVRKIISALPARDRDLLRAVFLEDKDKDAICRDIGVDRDYLRVLVHRAKDKFKAVYEKEEFGSFRRVTG
jgi:RNA polymerase sigma-70 factor, ECF subfamily